MAVKLRMLSARNGNHLQFFCPGCQETHMVQVGKGGWWFNGDQDKPELNPSVLVTSGHYVIGNPQPPDCPQCNYRDEQTGEPWPWPCGRCHSFIKAGEIQFLDDCTHSLAGKTVPLPGMH